MTVSTPPAMLITVILVLASIMLPTAHALAMRSSSSVSVVSALGIFYATSSHVVNAQPETNAQVKSVDFEEIQKNDLSSRGIVESKKKHEIEDDPAFHRILNSKTSKGSKGGKKCYPTTTTMTTTRVSKCPATTQTINSNERIVLTADLDCSTGGCAITGNCPVFEFAIGAINAVFDFNRHKITGPGKTASSGFESGIRVIGGFASGVTMKDGTVEKFPDDGIQTSGTNVYIENMSSTMNGRNGLQATGGFTSVTVIGSTFDENVYGVVVSRGVRMTMVASSANNNDETGFFQGIAASTSTSTLINSEFRDNRFNIDNSGGTLELSQVTACGAMNGLDILNREDATLIEDNRGNTCGGVASYFDINPDLNPVDEDDNVITEPTDSCDCEC